MPTSPAFLHGENLFWFVVAFYVLLVWLWAVICYLIIKWWLDRKRKDRNRCDAKMRDKESCDRLCP
jgi:hypothetical protein